MVESTQRAAQASLEWFEGIPRYVGQERMQFAFNLLTRSRRVTYDNLRLRDAAFVGEVDARVRRARWASARPPMFMPLRLRELELPNRVIVSPMDMYSAVDGTPGDFHLVHLGARSLGGAALVYSEMICVSDVGRITPGCAGMYRPEHVDGVAADRRLRARLRRRCAIGGPARPLRAQGLHQADVGGHRRAAGGGGWEVMAPSAIPYSAATRSRGR